MQYGFKLLQRLWLWQSKFSLSQHLLICYMLWINKLPSSPPQTGSICIHIILLIQGSYVHCSWSLLLILLGIIKTIVMWLAWDGNLTCGTGVSDTLAYQKIHTAIHNYYTYTSQTHKITLPRCQPELTWRALAVTLHTAPLWQPYAEEVVKVG